MLIQFRNLLMHLNIIATINCGNIFQNVVDLTRDDGIYHEVNIKSEYKSIFNV